MNEFLEKIHQELDQAMELRDHPEKCFVPKGALDEIWTTSRLIRLQTFLGIPKSKNNLATFRKGLIHTISILVFMGWRDWPRFASIYLHHCDLQDVRDRLDEKIPSYNSIILGQDDFLRTQHAARRFLECRNIFTPIILEEGKISVYDVGTRLPFINDETNNEKRLGEGGFGDVTKEIIAKRQLRFEKSGTHNEVRYLALPSYKYRLLR